MVEPTLIHRRFSFLCFVCVLSMALLTANSYADDYEAGRVAYNEGDFARTLVLWKPLADAGDPKAQFGLGTLFHEGKGVTKDYTQSAKWFEMAAEGGFPPAQFNIGNSYKHGKGVQQDDEKANFSNAENIFHVDNMPMCTRICAMWLTRVQSNKKECKLAHIHVVLH